MHGALISHPPCMPLRKAGVSSGLARTSGGARWHLCSSEYLRSVSLLPHPTQKDSMTQPSPVGSHPLLIIFTALYASPPVWFRARATAKLGDPGPARSTLVFCATYSSTLPFGAGPVIEKRSGDRCTAYSGTLPFGAGPALCMSARVSSSASS